MKNKKCDKCKALIAYFETEEGSLCSDCVDQSVFAKTMQIGNTKIKFVAPDITEEEHERRKRRLYKAIWNIYNS